MKDSLKHSVDAMAAAGVGATMLHLLPEISAGFAIVWYMIRIYEYIKEKVNGKS